MTTKSEKVAKMRLDLDRIHAAMEDIKNPDIGSQVDQKALEYMESHGGTYADALSAVLKASPDLAKEFQESFATTANG
jgi:hypothetical protein